MEWKRTGRIEIDGKTLDYCYVGFPLHGYVEVHTIENHLHTGSHKIPTTAQVNQPFRTGGHRYKILKVAQSIRDLNQ